MALIHPGYYNRMSWVYPYERNKQSKAYIPPYRGHYVYYMGSLNGGTSEAFVNFAESCSQRVHDDYDKGIVACFHDESHLNYYMREVNGEGLSPIYGCPEGAHNSSEAKIIIRDKVKVDSYFGKGHSFTKGEKIATALKRVWRAIRWYLYI